MSNLVPTSTGTPTVEGKNKMRANKEEGAWAFVDENIGSHLIRNAFGGGDEKALRKLLSIPAPYARSYRDDVTVTVVWWEDGREGEAKVESFTPEKAKL
jgi:pyruvate dehydrogenase phosphatase